MGNVNPPGVTLPPRRQRYPWGGNVAAPAVTLPMGGKRCRPGGGVTRRTYMPTGTDLGNKIIYDNVVQSTLNFQKRIMHNELSLTGEKRFVASS